MPPLICPVTVETGTLERRSAYCPFAVGSTSAPWAMPVAQMTNASATAIDRYGA